MNYPHTTDTTDPYAFPLWPDASAVSEELMMWAQAAKCAQPRLDTDNVYFDNLLDSTLAWRQSGTSLAEDTNWTSGGTVVGVVPNRGVPLPNATTMRTSTLALTTTPPFLTDNTDTLAQGFFFTHPQDFSTSFSGTPSLTDVSALPSPQSDDTGNGFLPFPTLQATSSYFVQAPGVPFPQVDIAGAMCPNQITGASSTSSMDDSSFSGQGESDLSPILNPIMTNPAPSDYTQLIDFLTTPAKALSTTVTPETVPSTSLGKRSRQRSEDGSGGLKRGKHATRVPGGAGSTNRIRRSPSTRTQQISKSISKAVGRGAERLASTTARELYHRSLLGLSVSQGSVGALEQEQPSWIEEREQMEARYDVGSSVPLQSVENARDGKLYKIPGKLTERERLMLQMTQADEERGAVRVIKCRVCPEREFGGWLTFRRHCNSCEKHPSALKFCSKCGDYFGRPDSEDRHKGKKYQGACLSTSQDEAKQKEQKVGRLLEAFEARLKHCLRTGEEIRPLFSDVVTKKLTNTSKKVSKREETWVEGNSWADGL